MSQLRTPLFRELRIPAAIEQALRQGASIAINHSGGKDSQAMEAVLCAWLASQGLLHRAFSIHCDLGRAEWVYSLPQCRRTSAAQGIPLVEVRPPNGDLLDYLERKAAAVAGTGTPFWPSKRHRWCTSLKRAACDKHFRRYPLIISAEGMRAEESRDRANKQPLALRTQITAKALQSGSIDEALAQRSGTQRVALTWLPIHDWTEADVWHACGTSLDELSHRRELWRAGDHHRAVDGWPAHRVYVMGNHRASCAICLLADQNDLRNGVRYHPELASAYLQLEATTGCTFRHGRSLASLSASVPVAGGHS
ncbi:MAG TPA: phosphoadenosine phosphosulfate reductase family protein [Herpetosiphonaceae bacterium]